MKLGQHEHMEYLQRAAQLAGVEVSEWVLPTDRDLVVEGMRLHYLDWGTAGLPPALFLHGGGLTAHTWGLVCLALRRDLHCIALDQRGHGDSEWSPGCDYSIESNVGDIAGFIDQLTFDKLVLVGMSMGGIHSIAYAARHSKRLKALVIVDTGPDVRVENVRRTAEFISAPAELDSVDEFVERALKFNPMRDRSVLEHSIIHNLRMLPNGKVTWKYDRRHRSSTTTEDVVENLRNLWDAVPYIKCPTLVVKGGLSQRLSDDDAERLATTLPDGRWVTVEDAGHTVQGDNPRLLIEVIRGFLAELPA